MTSGCDDGGDASDADSAYSDDPALMVVPNSARSLSGVGRYRDFIRRLPVHISKRILGTDLSLSLSFSMYRSLSLSRILSLLLSLRLSPYVFFSLSLPLSLSLSVCLSVCLYFHLTIYLAVCIG